MREFLNHVGKGGRTTMKRHLKCLSIIMAIAMLFTLQFTFAFADTPETAGPIVILHTNDVHSKVDGSLGYASVKGWKDYFEGVDSEVLVFDAGDALHGYPIANLNRGESIVEIMNAVGYTAMTPGNHDFNYGTARLMELSEMMEFDLLTANFTTNAGELVFAASALYPAGDMKVGVVGISTPETATKTNPLNVTGYKFNEATMAALVQAEIDKLLAGGADYIVALGHLGTDAESAPYRSTDLIGMVTDLDIFIDGHSHTTLETGQIVKDKDGNDVLLAQTGTQSNALGKIIIDGNTITASLITVAKDDATVKALIDAKKLEIQPLLDEVVAKTTVKLDGNRDPGVRTQETNLGDLAADALKYVSGADVALTNGGGIRTSVDIGDITYGELNAVFPFGNLVVTIEITGADLLAALEHGTKSSPAAAGPFPQVSGMSYEIHTYLEANRIQNVMVNGVPLDLTKTYTLATNDFLHVGGDGYTMFAKYANAGYFGGLDEALVAYIDEELGGTVGASYAWPQGRIKVLLTPHRDIISHWARVSIAKVVDEGLFAGVTATSFQPDATMTRAMFVTVLGRLHEADISVYMESEFDDVNISTWYGGYVQWAAANGIVSGVGNDMFAPNTSITREQMATILTNYCTFIDKGPVGAWAIQLTYTDLAMISDWANEGVMFATLKTYLTGYPDGSFGPKRLATRAEAAVILSNFLDEQAEVPAAL
jgi:5'-nucleotidase